MFLTKLLQIVRSERNELSPEQRSAVYRGLSAIFLDEEERTVYLKALQAMELTIHPLLEERLPYEELIKLAKDGIHSLTDEKLLILCKNPTMIHQIVRFLGEECSRCWIGRAKSLLK